MVKGFDSPSGHKFNLNNSVVKLLYNFGLTIRLYKIFLSALLLFSQLYAQDVSLYFGTIEQDSGSMEIYMSNTTNVSSFGIQLTGIILTSASGGSAEENGLILNINGENVVTGFGFDEGIPPGENTLLVNVLFSEVVENETCINPDLTNVFGGPDGISLEFTVGDCYPLDLVIFGCTDESACNYDPEATDDDGSCEGPEDFYDCDGNCLNDVDGDSVCDEFEIAGCTDESACNYNPDATDDDGSCEGPEDFYDCAGNCINDTDGDTVCDELEIGGCTDVSACNYNPEATDEDGSCDYPEECWNCFDDCICELDCSGICGGDTQIDDCGVCDGDNSTCTGCLEPDAVNYCDYCIIPCENCCEYESFITLLSPVEGDTLISASVEIYLETDINSGDQFVVRADGSLINEYFIGNNFTVPAVSVGSNLFNPRTVILDIQTVDSLGVPYTNPGSLVTVNVVFTPPEEFYTEQSTSQAFYFLYAATIDGIPLEGNDWIGAFCDTVCVGNKWWYLDVSDPPVTVPAFGDDGSFPGFCNNGDEVIFRMYDHSDSVYYTMATENIDPEGGWTNFGFYQIDSMYAIITDCAGVINGEAVVDECGICCGGTTGNPCSYYNDESDFGGGYDCTGVCNGDSVLDECDVCGGGNYDCTNEESGCICSGCTESDAENYDPDSSIDDGSCVYQYSRDLYEGQNLISFWALPEDTSISSVMASIEDCVVGVIGEGIAAILQDDGTWIGSLSQISYYSGYWVKTEENCSMTHIGSRRSNLIYDLHDGPNLISFPDPGQIGISEGIPDEFEPIFMSVIGEGIAASQVTPFFWVGSLQNWHGADGYWVTLHEAITFNFNLPDEFIRKNDNLNTASHHTSPWKYNQSTEQAFYFVEDVQMDGLQAGSFWLLAYCGESLVGAREWTGPYTDIPAMGDDSSPETAGYCEPGETPNFKLQINNGKHSVSLTGYIPEWQSNELFFIDLNTTTVDIPAEFVLYPVFPNPFNSTTEIEFSLNNDGIVNVIVFNITGQEVARIFDGYLPAGSHNVHWNAVGISSGVYYIHLNQGNRVQTTKTVLLK